MIDPGIMMLLASLASGGIGALTGSQGETKSTYGKGALILIDQIQQQIKGGMGGPQQDITQAPGYQAGNEWLQSMFSDPGFFQNVEAPAFRQLNEEILPGIASRFASQGSGGSLGSTGFRNALGRAGTDLSTNLSAMRTGMQQQAAPQLLNFAQQPAQNWMSMLQNALMPTQNIYQGPSSGGFGALAAPFAQGAASIFGQRAGQQAGNPQQQQYGFPGQSPLTY